ncbi:deacetylase [Candidatus Parcubacteria bacterium]|nr:MAG: deacetylase [Candidatus Parcubacteria bacterium]
MKLIITVDTERDNEWKRPDSTSLENIKFLQRFQDLCQKYGFKPTYLLTYEVASDPQSVKILKAYQEKLQAEIGAHLHPWTSPPFEQERSWEDKVHRFPHELSDKELRDKMAVLTQTIIDNFGIRPKSFRAGRWGFDARVARELIRQNYIVDCSVTPKISWQKTKGDPQGQGGPDYRFFRAQPYFVSPQDINEVGHSALLEVPMTILFTGLFKKENNFLHNIILRWPESFVKKVVNRLFFRLKWLRIFPNSKPSDFKRIYKAAKKNSLPVLEFMIHSSELMPGGSPYAKDEEQVDKIYHNLEAMLAYFKKQGVKGTTLSEFYYDFK